MKSTAKAKINTINIDGNKEISDSFILEFIGLEKGTELDLELLDSNISELYSLGYFKTLYYEIHPLLDGWVDIIIRVNESSLRKFQLGLRWDNLYLLVGVANVQLNSRWLPGFRIEDQIQFATGIINGKLIFLNTCKLSLIFDSQTRYPITVQLHICNTH